MTGYAERFPFDCMVCGDELDTETVGGHASDFSSSGGEQRYDPEQDAYFVRITSEEYRRVRREISDVAGADGLEGFLLHLKGRHVGPSGRKQPRGGLHRTCGTTVREYAAVFDDAAEAERFEPGDRYDVGLPLTDLKNAFPRIGEDAFSLPDVEETVTVQLERMEHYEDGIPTDLL